MATLSATRILPALWMLAVLPSAAEPGTAERLQVLAQEVTAAERDFARSMAERTIWHRDTGPEGGARWRVIVDQGVPLIECGGPNR
jgi:hypothetical protein